MVCLPENEKEENTQGETAAESVNETDLSEITQRETRAEEDDASEAVSGKQFGMGFLSGVLTALICVCVFLLGWTLAQRTRLLQQRKEARNQDLGAEVLTDYRTLSKLEEVQNLIEQHYLREVDSDTLSDYLFKGIACGLGDDYSNYYSPRELETVLDSSQGVYFGIGITIEEDTQTHEFKVVQVYDGSPAEEAGLAAGDIILGVNGVSIKEKSLSELTEQIKAQEASFSMTVSREGTGELELELECGTVELSAVEYEMMEHGIGYIRITDFTGNAVKQFRNAIEDLDGQGMTRLIVDLRDNPGGLLDSVNEILDDILPEGLIVYAEDRDGERSEFTSDREQTVTCEIAVLVNGGSASASEIFAGAVQDYELGPIIGTQTYGKGVIQDTYTLSDGSAFKMTTRKYFTPKGQDIEGNGIVPDIVVEDGPEDAVLAKALEVLTSQD